MSSDDGDDQGGWYDDLRNEWDQPTEDQIIYEYTSPDAPEGWQEWREHDIEGSHWHVESERFSTQEEALSWLEDMRENPGDHINGGIGNFAELAIYWDEYNDEYYVEGEAYVEY